MTSHERRRLTAVARGDAPADLYLRGGTLLNVYTGELYPANVAIRGEVARTSVPSRRGGGAIPNPTTIA